MVTVPRIPLKELNNSISSLSNRVNFDQIENAANTAANQLQAATSTLLGVTVNQNVAGWQSLTQEVDNLDDGTSVLNSGLALLQGNPPGVNLVTELSSGNQTALQSITGLTSEISGGLNTVVHALPTPEGVASALNTVGNIPFDQLRSAISEIAPTSLRSLSASSAIQQLTNQGIFNNFENVLRVTNSPVESFLNTGFNQIVKDLIETTTNPIGFAIGQLTQDTGRIVPNSVKRRVALLIDQGQFFEAAKLLQPFSNLELTTLETELSSVDTTLGSLVDRFDPAFNAFGVSSAPTYSIGRLDGEWNGTETTTRRPGTTSQGYAFTYISSMEELEAELRSATREITETVIHWTANYINQPHIGAEDIHQWHLDRGWSGCGYHYIFKRDGSIQRGRPINIQGAHAAELGHNQYSIGVSHVAGYNCVSGTPNPGRFISAESISDAQWKAQRDFLEVFYRVFPGGQVLGHNQTDNDKVDPGFDVDAYILNTFNKRNIFVYNRDRGPLSRAELIAARRTSGAVA
jgi:N-acetylmuramoyl-L-alanine amidase